MYLTHALVSAVLLGWPPCFVSSEGVACWRPGCRHLDKQSRVTQGSSCWPARGHEPGDAIRQWLRTRKAKGLPGTEHVPRNSLTPSCRWWLFIKKVFEKTEKLGFWSSFLLTFLLTENVPEERLLPAPRCLTSALIVLNAAIYANSRRGLYGACQRHLSPFYCRTPIRDSCVFSGSRLILGSSMRRAVVFITKKHFFVLWRFLKLSPVPPISYLFSCEYQALNGWKGRVYF